QHLNPPAGCSVAFMLPDGAVVAHTGPHPPELASRDQTSSGVVTQVRGNESARRDDDEQHDEVEAEQQRAEEPQTTTTEHLRTARRGTREPARRATLGLGPHLGSADSAVRFGERLGWSAHSGGCYDCARRSAASTAFRNSIAIVVGPTPPTRGVIHPATSSHR